MLGIVNWKHLSKKAAIISLLNHIFNKKKRKEKKEK